ncbi:prolyl 3-hydroxylase 3 [Pimephales promelas]|uniref:prolyl 3-hydroxylase 3 n=1 Tax=Pimephales promelas TaxID=90988 RepID=UPI0019559DB6|nr:prolyl 3-hydroxylase 3 [Pimephales promelas]KAG1947792.1 prolyl 3-hydroxylase [Pimephales promelas]
MAILSNTIPVYVAFLFILKYVSKTAGSGLSSESSSRLLPPYDELYYRGVRAYFREDWERAAEFLEKSISTRDMLLRTRRKCHDECLTIGDEKFSKLDRADVSLWDLGVLEWMQLRAECVRFCMGRSVSPAALLPVSSDIEYEFETRNPYNYLQVTYYKLGKMDKAASAAHTFFVANPSHLEMRNNIEKYRRMIGVKDESFQDREREQEQHWEMYDAAILAESSSDWVKAVKKWKECVNGTLKQTEECRAQCVMAPQVFPEETDTARGVYERAADLSLSLLSCKQMCVTLVSTRPGRVSALEDFLPLQLEHLHIAQFKAGDLKGAVETLRSLMLFYPTDSDSLSNLELYSQALEGDTEAQETGPLQEIAKYVSRALEEKSLLYFGMANLDFKFSDPDLWTPEDVVPEALRETWRAEKERLHEKLKQGQKVEEVDESGFYAGGPVPVVGVTITMDDQGLNGTNRVVLDGVLSQSECDRVMQLAAAAASVGDGYQGRRSPHTPHEKFEGLTVLRALKLAQDGQVNQSDARLLHEIGETVKVLMDSYFRSHSPLYFAYTHLVCRSAIPGKQEGRSDLSHPVHVDNCILEPETRQCWREAPAFTHRDLSAVVYLNDDFEGGDFFFTDRDTKTVTAKVKPRCGRLVGFTSGPVNPHGVTAVTEGRRCALALWFTTEKLHRDMEREEAEALWTADGQSVVKEDKGDTESALKSARSGRSQGKERSKERDRVTGRRDEL